MGFFKSVGNVLKTVSPTAIATAINPALGLLVGGSTVAKNMQPDKAPAPDEVDQPFKNATADQNNYAQQFYTNLDKYKEDQFNLAATPGRASLAQDMRKTNEGSNRRGLLYSGLAQKAQLDTLGAKAQNEANMRQTINQNADQLARDQLYESLQNSLALQDMEAGRNNTIYQGLLNDQASKQAITSGILGGLGSIGGAAAGRR